ncbi:MAG TPA: glycosyl hydrolase [Armatimonadota bacterium]|jgi:hypothetical protein
MKGPRLYPWLLLLVLIPVTALAAPTPGADGPRAAQTLVPAHGAYLGAYVQLDPVVKGDLAAFEKLVGRPHYSYLRYVGYGEPFPHRWAQEVVARGGIPQIAWEPNNGLAEVQEDAYLRGWAEAARHLGAPVLLRYASEMNGNWMPYSGKPDEYIRKWRLVYRVMHETAPNVVMIWCPFGTPRSNIPLYYPGDDYVDWVGINIYAVVYNNGDPKQPAEDTQLDQLRFVYNLYAERKPIAVCEYAATHFCSASKQCTTDFALKNMREFYEALPKLFPRVMFVSWFSVEASADGLAHNDYAVTTDPAVLNLYRELIQGDYFLAGPSAGAPVTPTTPDLPLIRPLGAVTAVVPKPPVRPTRPLPLIGQAVPGPSEVALSMRGAPPQAATGRVTLTATVGEKLTPDTVVFYLDGQVRCLTNMRPYTWDWNTAGYDPGEHAVRVVVTGADGSELAVREVSVIIADQ